MDEKKKQALQAIDRAENDLCQASDTIWDHPETAFFEQHAMETHCRLLETHGFAVTRGYGDLETAFSGRFGSGNPVIGLLGEFDALAAMSQEAECLTQQAAVPGGNGHGCGHHLLGVGAIGAAIAVKDYLEKTGASGTVIYYGCPGEEGGSGKAFMARDGVFDELDCAITWHPGDRNQAAAASTLANFQVRYHFTGVTSHAAVSPHLGRSALDALELMNVGVQFLREHVIQEARIHYAVTETGGASPNVVQGEAEVLYLIRAPKTPQVREIYERINKIAQGAAMMTETEVDIRFDKACSNIVPNTTLTEQLHANLEEIPLPEYTEQERAFAQAISQTCPPNTGAAYLGRSDKGAVTKEMLARPLRDFVLPPMIMESAAPGSSDVGDVSWVCPVAQISTVTMAAGTPFHSWQLVSQGKSGVAHKGMIYAAKVMAGTVIDLLECPEMIARARVELEERLDGAQYIPPIPPDCKPNSGQSNG